MKIKITNPKYFWHRGFKNQEFEVLPDLPNHHQYPVMAGGHETWFDKDACTVIEE